MDLPARELQIYLKDKKSSPEGELFVFTNLKNYDIININGGLIIP